MFFTGDSSTRKRVDLGGRSSKERDRQKLLEQTRLERNRRLSLRQQNFAALKIQKCFRGRKVSEAACCRMREQFHDTYGKHCEKVDRHCFGPDSEFFHQLLFFYNAKHTGDFSVLVEACRLLQQFVRDNGDVLSIFAGKDYLSNKALVDYRVKKFAYACIQTVYHNRNQLRNQLFAAPENSSTPATLLLDAIVFLLQPELPWVCKIVGYFLERNAYVLIRDITLAGKETEDLHPSSSVPSLERLLSLLSSHVGEKPCCCPRVDPNWSFSSQILTLPLLWQTFPYLKEVFARRGLIGHYIHQMASCVQHYANVLPKDVTADIPGYACLLGNVLEISRTALSQPDCSSELAVDLASITTFLLELLPSMKSPLRDMEESAALGDDDVVVSDQEIELPLNKNVEKQICDAIDPRFLLQLANALFGQISQVSGPYDGPDDKEVKAVGTACAFLHVTFNTLPLEQIMTVLAYRTELVPVLWNFIKKCHENQKWSSFSEKLAYLSGDAPGWLLPLAVFCPVYKHMLTIIDNEEFYEQEKPLSLKDIRCLIIILRQALWQLLWVSPTAPSNSAKPAATAHVTKRHTVEFIQYRVTIVASELLSQLQDWNNRRQFTPPSDFHADAVNDYFISQAVIENTRAHDILKQAPFLVPFTSRVKIFTSQLTAARQRNGSHAVFARNRFRIRRDHILEDAFSQMSALSEDDLRGSIRVSFVNEFGVEEAGIDGGGIFKDFMENITRAAFDVQYGLFKETADHLLYPNPGSGMIHEQHLQFFHFLGVLLAKAMFEGILVDIPFATFFLSKLKQKYNYLNDLPSLDPELYRHLIFLKHFEGDISELELYFVIINNEYGEQTEEELLPGGKNRRVTSENVITFIHLVANHRLNFQIRQQSSHFLRGFQQLIQKEWIDMFNEHEFQLLISGSLDGLDVDDLRTHTTYSSGYHKEHYVIEMFWEVIKSFSVVNQKKFLKFVTGCSRGPLLGFRYLEPCFCIQRAAGNANEEALDRLPTSATCMNLLKLPPYRSKEQLANKLMYAINADAGFDLS
ncbi:E3 ubiquitin-protein ligase UPL6, partial [Cucurbita argyrosperma subsp. sororia]